ncbi:hypothetical protein G9A89_009205 [Geosiphon pyriformis]|nr:hypothetical protein G9A89_009205 [Geosiphon pyriformis]
MSAVRFIYSDIFCPILSSGLFTRFLLLNELRPASVTTTINKTGSSNRDEGVDTEQNDKLAFYWYKIAPKAGLPIAQCNLRYAYDQGARTLLNHKKGFECYLKAVRAENQEAMRNVGYCYHWGKDEKIAILWFRIAAFSGSHDA